MRGRSREGRRVGMIVALHSSSVNFTLVTPVIMERHELAVGSYFVVDLRSLHNLGAMVHCFC